LARARPAVVTVICTNEKGEEASFGSGCIVAGDGVVLTAWHVVAGAVKVRVQLPTGVSRPVQGLVGWDASKDFALLKITGTNLPTVRLGDSDKVRQGDRILTLGAPLGLEQTASDGIVSAVRELPDGTKLLQTTAAISAGSSGGPVLNTRGQAVGMACFLLTEGQSLNFAVPINDVKPKLKARGKVTPLADAATGEFAGSPEALYQQGWAALLEDKEAPHAAEQFQKALALFRQAVEKRNDYDGAWFSAGYCLVELERYQEALDCFKQAIRIMPNYAGARWGLGTAYLGLGRYQDSLESFKEAIRIKPDLAGFHSALAGAYLMLGRYHEALQACKEAIRLEPGLGAGHYGLGLAHLFLGDRSRALDEYKILKDLDADLAAKLFERLYP
jgi:hypothetical protein